MYWDVTAVKPVAYLTLKVKFEDGLEGTVSFKKSHLTGVFARLNDENYFNQVFVDHGVVTWPEELDLAPDAMYKAIKEHGSWVLE